MDTLTIEIELPRDLLAALNIPTTQAGQRATEWVVIELFREGEISGGKAAEILGMTKSQFISFVSLRGIAYLDTSPGELAADVQIAQQAAYHH